MLYYILGPQSTHTSIHRHIRDIRLTKMLKYGKYKTNGNRLTLTPVVPPAIQSNVNLRSKSK